MSRPFPTHKPYSKTSPDGRLRVDVSYRKIDETRSDGSPVRWKQPVFQMENAATGQIVWTREGNWRTEAYSTVYVSDDGWSVLRFPDDGGQPARLVAVSPEGRDVLTVGISRSEIPGIPDSPPVSGEYFLWLDEHVRHTSAGVFWATIRIRFVSWAGCPYFVCRTKWGRYLLMDLNKARVLDEKDPRSEEFFLWLRRADEQWALDILQKTCEHRIELESCLSAERLDKTKLPDHLAEFWDKASDALIVVRQERALAAAALLEQLQSFSDPDYAGTIDISPVNSFGSLFRHSLRNDVHLAMLSIGAKPKGFAINIFNEVGYEHFLDVPECVESREAMIRALRPGIAPKDMVFQLGAPEYIRDSWHDGVTCPWGDDFHFECWDYDEPDQDGTPVSWGLLWRRPKKPLSPEEKNQSTGDIMAELLSGSQDADTDEPSEDKSAAELVSITRFVWSDAYRRLREEGYPIG